MSKKELKKRIEKLERELAFHQGKLKHIYNALYPIQMLSWASYANDTDYCIALRKASKKFFAPLLKDAMEEFKPKFLAKLEKL